MRKSVGQHPAWENCCMARLPDGRITAMQGPGETSFQGAAINVAQGQ